MSTIPTQNPVPSEAAKDLKFNSGKIDEFVTSMKNKYIDRFGQEHFTIEGLRWIAQQAISQFGYITLDSFQKGAEITLPNQVLRDEVTGEYYRWDGALPKSVPIGSTPENSGGIGVNAWLSVGDASLRSELISPTGTSIIGHGDKTLDEVIDDLNFKINNTSSDYAKKNRHLLGVANKKIRTGEAVKIVCVGDSVTAGHDTNSPDVIQSPNGNSHTVAPIQYPSRVQDRLNALTSSHVSVINRGYSGDTAKVCFSRWNANPNADVAHIMLGINDASGVGGATFDEYSKYLELLIRKYIDWGCGVVVHTCTAINFNNYNSLSSVYSQHARTIASTYGCPVFESEGELQYCDKNIIYSDSTHFNKAGYAKYGDSVASFIMSGGWIGQQKKVSSYTSQQTGRGSEGIGFFVKKATLSMNESSYVRNQALVEIANGAVCSFSFYLDSEFATVHLLGSLVEGTEISCSSPEGESTGLIAYNKMQIKRENNKKIAETSGYSISRRNGSSGGKAYAGSLVGRGWKTVYIRNPSTNPSYINYIVIEPSSPHIQNQTSDDKYGVMYCHSAVDEIFVYQSPFYDRDTGSTTIPVRVKLDKITIPLPSALISRIATNGFFDSRVVYITIKTVSSSNESSLSNGITKIIAYRDSASNLLKFDVEYKTNESSLVPDSIFVTSTKDDGSNTENSFPRGGRNGWLNMTFSNPNYAYFSIEVRGARLSNSDHSFLS